MTIVRTSRAGSRDGQPAAFFDRDGVLIVDHGYVCDPDRLDIVDGAVEAVRLCNEAGFLVLVATNQSGVARGLFDDAAVGQFHEVLRERFARGGAAIDDIRYCPHHPAFVTDNRCDCDCRKPKPGMLLALAEAWSVDLGRSFMVGDQQSDMAAAAAAGVVGLLYEGEGLPALVRKGLALGREPAVARAG